MSNLAGGFAGGVAVIGSVLGTVYYTVGQINAIALDVAKQSTSTGSGNQKFVNIPPYIKSINGKFKLHDFLMSYTQRGLMGIVIYLVCYIIGNFINDASQQPGANKSGGFFSELRTLKYLVTLQQKLYNEKIRCNLASTTCRNNVNLWKDKYASDPQWKVAVFDNHVFGYHRELRYFCCGLRRVFRAVPLQFSDYCEAKSEDFTGCQFPVAWFFVIFGITSGFLALRALRERDEGSPHHGKTLDALNNCLVLAIPPLAIFFFTGSQEIRTSGLRIRQMVCAYGRTSSAAFLTVVALGVLLVIFQDINNPQDVCDKSARKRSFQILQCDIGGITTTTTPAPTTACVTNKDFDACSTVNFSLILTFAALQFVVAIVATVAVCCGRNLPCLRGWKRHASYTFHGPSEAGFPMTVTVDNDREILDEITQAVVEAREPMLAHRRPVYAAIDSTNRPAAPKTERSMQGVVGVPTRAHRSPAAELQSHEHAIQETMLASDAPEVFEGFDGFDGDAAETIPLPGSTYVVRSSGNSTTRSRRTSSTSSIVSQTIL
eukprot:m.341101 g.341101  ORF g.341101 m.341101 type:complete len:546 (+) comp20606_c0_seq2:307-1944(+)